MGGIERVTPVRPLAGVCHGTEDASFCFAWLVLGIRYVQFEVNDNAILS